MGEQTPEVADRNPLRRMYPQSFRSFEAWQERFLKAEYFDEMLGLLHGLREEKNDYPLGENTALFLLEIADGYDRHNFSNLDGTQRYYGDSDIQKRRKLLAQKAFQVLCLAFFKEEREYGYAPKWENVLYSEALFKKVLWFLRPNLRYSGTNYRFEEKPEHPYDIFMKFVQEFVKFGWDFNGQVGRYKDRWYGETREASRQRFLDARPQFIEIMETMKMLRWLGAQELDGVCLQKLTSMAMEREYKFPDCDYGKERKPKNLQEAVWAGSVPAQILLFKESSKAQQAIYDHEAEVRQREREENARKEEVAKILNEQIELAKRVKELEKV